MRDRPFINGSEAPRLYSDLLAERAGSDSRARVLDEINRLEREAQDALDPVRAKQFQCAAEGLRAALDEQPKGLR